MPRMTKERVGELANAAVSAGVRNDRAALLEAVTELYTEGDAGDSLRWTMAMIGTATAGVPRKCDMPDVDLIVRPRVGMFGPDGTVREVPMDEAPLGAATYARLCAAWLMDDGNQAIALWRAMVEIDDQEGMPQTSLCMYTALMQAVAATRRGLGDLQ